MQRPYRLKRTIGSDYAMDLDDAFNTKRALRDLGHYRVPDYGLNTYPDQRMIDGVKSFQQRNGLREDGLMKPDGPTIKRINQTLAERQMPLRAQIRTESPNAKRSPSIFGIGSEIGHDRENRPQDVLSTRRALAWAGRLSRHKAKNETRAGNDLFNAIKRFQQVAKLKVDGWMRPGGETETELDRVIAPLVKQASATTGETDTSKNATNQTSDQQQAAAAAIPAIVYKIAEYFGMAVMAAGAWWQAMSAAERSKVRRQVEDGKSDDSEGDDCDHLYYNVDKPVCNAIARKRGKQAAARCYASASERYAACRRGVPKDQLPPLDTWNN